MPLKNQAKRASSVSAGQVSKSGGSEKATILEAAQLVGIDPRILWGVYGTESDFGRNLGPSSAGARGPMQFMPTTGARYGLNNVTIMQFRPSVFAAAHYLKSLGATLLGEGDTRQALNNYNGNSGGRSETSYTKRVEDLGATYAPGHMPRPLNDLAGRAAGLTASGVKDITGAASAGLHGIEAVGELALNILNPTKWGELIANTTGVVILKIGKAVYRYALLPPWHWTERATDYYIRNELSISDTPEANPILDNRALQTIAFWSLGFVLLWGQVEDSEVRDPQTGQFVKKTRFGIGAEPRQSSLGRSITTVVNGYKAQTKLKKSASTKEGNTKEQPKPILSEAPIRHTRSVSVKRNRIIKVEPIGNATPEHPAHSGQGKKKETQNV